VLIISRKYSHLLRPLWQVLSVLVACNYFAFRVELFRDEYEENHPNLSPGTVSFSQPTLNWETFDKDNASTAFTIKVDLRFIFITYIDCPLRTDQHTFEPYSPIRDKSPPHVVSPKPAA
jgi:hypothetical protein